MARNGTVISMQLSPEDMLLVENMREGTTRGAVGWPKLTQADTIRFLIRQGYKAVSEQEAATLAAKGAAVDAAVGVQV